MKLAIFDIDGTLTDTNSIDDDCFLEAFRDALALTGINTNWHEYPHTTDSGIVLNVFEERYGREPRAEEINKLQQHFFGLMKEQCALDATLFAEIKGAAAAFNRLRKEEGWAVAIATGCWRESAVLKLKAAQIDFDEIPAGFAEDAISREEILRTAMQKSLAQYGQSEFEKIVSLGDGLWDVRAAARLNLPFVGVAVGEKKALLHQAGARHVLEDFTDYALLLKYLDEAEVPSQRG